MLTVEGLSVKYGSVIALDDVSLELAHGAIIAILGANGAGKSSLLRACAGLVRPSAGTIHWNGVRTDGRPAHKIARDGLVLVPEGRRVFANLTVEENLQLGAHGVARRQRRETPKVLGEIFDMFPILRDRRHGLAGLLSGGEQQMLAFGRAMMAMPKGILMDEPSLGLSPVMVDLVLSATEQIAARGISVLMVEQNAAALDIAPTAIVLARGKIVAQGSSADLRRTDEVRAAFLGG